MTHQLPLYLPALQGIFFVELIKTLSICDKYCIAPWVARGA